MPTPKPAFPLWVIAGGLLLSAVYLPTLAAPFDFLDDGNLVYPSRGLSAEGHLKLWWEKVAANVEHLGPFRPVVWAHWELAANLYGADPVAWRVGRLAWCAVSAGMLLWLMRELKLPPLAAMLATAAAMWNPYRNEIWVSLTLAEGVAMPYALLAFVAARKGATATRRAWAWDAAAVLGLLFALGCKNTFVALIPPMILLRTWGDGTARAKVLAAAVYAAPALLPVAHLIYLKQHPGPCHYETPGPSWGQAVAFTSWLKGAAGVDFLAVGVLAVAGVLGWRWRHALPRPGGARETPAPLRVAAKLNALPLLFGVTLLACGFIVYLPVDIMCGRYTMPAVWGVDVLFAALLGRLIPLPGSWQKRLTWVAVGVGLAAVAVAGIGRQEKAATRSRLLWQVLDQIEQSAPPGAVVEWVSGRGEDGDLNAEEGIHFYWHLLHRGRADVRVRLVDVTGERLHRVELPPPPGPARFRIVAVPTDDPAWQTTAVVREPFHFGRRAFAAAVQEPVRTSASDPFAGLLEEPDPLKRLLPPTPPTGPVVAEVPGGQPR